MSAIYRASVPAGSSSAPSANTRSPLIGSIWWRVPKHRQRSPHFSAHNAFPCLSDVNAPPVLIFAGVSLVTRLAAGTSFVARMGAAALPFFLPGDHLGAKVIDTPMAACCWAAQSVKQAAPFQRRTRRGALFFGTFHSPPPRMHRTRQRLVLKENVEKGRSFVIYFFFDVAAKGHLFLGFTPCSRSSRLLTSS